MCSPRSRLETRASHTSQSVFSVSGFLYSQPVSLLLLLRTFLLLLLLAMSPYSIAGFAGPKNELGAMPLLSLLLSRRAEGRVQGIHERPTDLAAWKIRARGAAGCFIGMLTAGAYIDGRGGHQAKGKSKDSTESTSDGAVVVVVAAQRRILLKRRISITTTRKTMPLLLLLAVDGRSAER